MTNVSQPVLAEAADMLSDQLRMLLTRLGAALRPESDRLESRYVERLRTLGFDLRQRRALAALTVGAAARFLGRRRPPAEFFEQVEYNGRRLAKLNLSPAAIVSALAEYDKLLEPVLEQRLPAECGNFQWVRDQLQFCVLLTLNNAYYHVREAETQAFYEMFWAELQAQNLDDLLRRFLAILARFSKADEGRLYLIDTAGRLVERAAFGEGGPPAKTEALKESARLRKQLERPKHGGPRSGWVLEREWGRKSRGGYRRCWSVPLVAGGRLAGVMQFAFLREYDWLPREHDLLTAAAERCMMAAEKAKLLEDLAAQERQIRQLAENLMHVEEAERRRISHELHDQTGQDLLWIRLQMEMMERDLPPGDEQWRERLATVRDMTERTIVEIRRLIAALSPAVLEQLGLAPALRQMVNRFRMAHPVTVKLQIGRLEPLSKQLETIGYRLVQECLNNVAKHSSCEEVNISVQTDDGILRLLVEDDGVGFHVEDRVLNPDSFGLAGIRERVTLLGGQCRIESTPRQPRSRKRSGTRVIVELPVTGGSSALEVANAGRGITAAAMIPSEDRPPAGESVFRPARGRKTGDRAGVGNAVGR
ncbi:MAG: GAF domain-containing sensor histidine kinase [Bryobacteraceae bacterium]